MKKLALVFVAFLMFASLSQAQYIFDKGDIGINAGLGVGYFGTGYIPSIEVSGEYGAIPTGDIGLVAFGGVVGYKYSVYTYDYSYLEDFSYHQLTFGARATWHLHTFKSDKWDVYAGIGFGVRLYQDATLAYNLTTGEYESYPNNFTDPYGEGFVGGRMMMSDSFGLFAEAGYSSLSAIRFGLTFLL